MMRGGNVAETPALSANRYARLVVGERMLQNEAQAQG